MRDYKKKIAPRDATPETKNKKPTINSILVNGGNVKVYIKKPGELPWAIRAGDIPQEFLSKKLKSGHLLSSTLALVCDPKSKESVNLSVGKIVYRGTVVMVRGGIDRIYPMGYSDANDAFVWLMNHRV